MARKTAGTAADGHEHHQRRRGRHACGQRAGHRHQRSEVARHSHHVEHGLQPLHKRLRGLQDEHCGEALCGRDGRMERGGSRYPDEEQGQPSGDGQGRDGSARSRVLSWAVICG